MTIYLIRKKKGRIYRSETIVPLLLQQEGLQGLTFRHGVAGVPELVTGTEHLAEKQSPYRISISDTKNYWCAVIAAGSGLGIDLEEAGREVTPQLIKRLHPLEQKYLSGLQAGGREWTEEFLSVWTRKEAYSKYCAAGLSMGFSRFSVVDESLYYGRTICCQNRPEAFVQSVALGSTLFCALCTEKQEKPGIARIDYDGLPAVSPQEAAAGMLAIRSLSSAELKNKLTAKGYTEEEALSTAEEMAAKGYTDDEAYAVRQAAMEAKKGRSRCLIQRNLAARGLGSSEIAAAMEQLDCDEENRTEFDRAMAAAEKLFPLPNEKHFEEGLRIHPDEKQLAKIGRKLASLGYGPSVIYKVLDRYRR